MLNVSRNVEEKGEVTNGDGRKMWKMFLCVQGEDVKAKGNFEEERESVVKEAKVLMEP